MEASKELYHNADASQYASGIVVHEKEPITPADRTAVLISGQAEYLLSKTQLTAIEMNCSSVTFLSRHLDSVTSNNGRPSVRPAYEAILTMGSTVLNL